MVVTAGVFMGELGKETEEAVLVVGKLIGERRELPESGHWHVLGWLDGAFCLGSRRHSMLVWRPVNDQSYTELRALLNTNNKIPRYFDAAASQHPFVFVGD
jgi:hypothetical protein